MFLCFEAMRENFYTFSTFRSFKQALSSGGLSIQSDQKQLAGLNPRFSAA